MIGTDLHFKDCSWSNVEDRCGEGGSVGVGVMMVPKGRLKGELESYYNNSSKILKHAPKESQKENREETWAKTDRKWWL